jgi:hypothetical protein
MEYNPCTGAISYNFGTRFGGEEVVPESIREWVQEKEHNRGSLSISFQDGTKIMLSPKSFDKNSGELILDVKVKDPEIL